ncbi:unnamed protein product, partial [Amoebophrya sp. A120]|eukprot:GSA120T00006727001.1
MTAYVQQGDHREEEEPGVVLPSIGEDPLFGDAVDTLGRNFPDEDADDEVAALQRKLEEARKQREKRMEQDNAALRQEVATLRDKTLDLEQKNRTSNKHKLDELKREKEDLEKLVAQQESRLIELQTIVETEIPEIPI